MLLPPFNLPDRPLSLPRNAISTPKAYFWSTPVILLLAVIIAVAQGPGLIRDFQISQNPVPLDDGTIDQGRCTTRKFAFTDCNAQLRYTYQGHSYESHVEVMFIDLHFGDYETGIVVSGDHPELATMSLGLDKLWNRIITFSVFSLLLVGTSLLMLLMGLRIWRVRGQLERPAHLVPIPVELTSVQGKTGRMLITYSDKIAEDRTKRTAYTRMRQGEEPLVIGAANGKPVALAVRHGRTALPVLLDRQLRRIDLTEEERRAALESLAPYLSDEDSARVEQHGPASRPSIWRGIKAVFGFALLMTVGILGFWLWYVLASPTQFQSPGMDINNAMPKPLNDWGCAQLKKRFGQDRAPFGCVAADYQSWK